MDDGEAEMRGQIRLRFAATKKNIWRHEALDMDGMNSRIFLLLDLNLLTSEYFDSAGIASPGLPVENKQVMVNKSMPAANRDPLEVAGDPNSGFRDVPTCYKGRLFYYVLPEFLLIMA